LEKLDQKERVERAKAQKSKIVRVDKNKGSQMRQVWEFENYIKERLRALGIIQ